VVLKGLGVLHQERECCLLVLNLVSSTLPCIRQPRPRLWTCFFVFYFDVYSKVPVPASRTCFFVFYFDVVLKGPGACNKNLLFYFLFWCGTQRSRCLQQEPAFLFFILMWYSKVPMPATRNCFFVFCFDVVLKGPGACSKNLFFYFLFWCGTQRSRCLQQEPVSPHPPIFAVISEAVVVSYSFIRV